MLAALLTTADALLPRKADPALAGEIAALRPLVRAVVAQVLREPFDHPDVEDVTQEALRRAVEGKSRPSGPPRPWLLGIARHVALDTIRGRRRDRGRFDDGQAQAAPESTPALLVERLADPASDVCESMLEQERRTRVLAAIARLPDGPRAALELFVGNRARVRDSGPGSLRDLECRVTTSECDHLLEREFAITRDDLHEYRNFCPIPSFAAFCNIA